MIEKRKVSIVLEDDFGRVQTTIETELSPSDLMDNILWSLECEKQLFTKKQLHEENQHIKHLIKQAYNNERTTLGRNVLKQLIEQME